MAFLFVESLTKITKSKFLQRIIKVFEILLLSAGLISTLAMIKGSAIVPYSCEIVFSSILGFWNSVKCFLSSSLFICIFINFTVMLIAVSSAFHHHHKTDNQDNGINLNISVRDDTIIVESPPPPSPPIESPPPPPRIYIESPPPPSPSPTLPSVVALISNETLISESIKEKNIIVTSDISYEKEEGEEEDTMEATWKAITGGSGEKKRRSRKIKKSETWDVNIPPRRGLLAGVQRVDSEELVGAASPTWRELRKSETFDGAVAMRLRGGMIRRDPSMSIEEFNEQVEAFIKKFNDNMRLQRQESEMRFLDSIQRGV